MKLACLPRSPFSVCCRRRRGGHSGHAAVFTGFAHSDKTVTTETSRLDRVAHVSWLGGDTCVNVAGSVAHACRECSRSVSEVWYSEGRCLLRKTIASKGCVLIRAHPPLCPQHPIDAAACYAELLGNRGGTQLSAQLPDLRRVDADRAALGNLPAAFALAMPSALAFQHDLALPRRHAGQDRQHELAGRVAGVQSLATHAQDHQADAALRQVGLEGEQFGRAACQPVRLGDVQGVAVAQEGEALVRFRPLRHAGRLFAEYLLRPCGLQVALLRCQAGRLFQVDVRAYPTIIARRPFVLLAFKTSCGIASEKYRDISLGRDFRDFLAMVVCPGVTLP